MTETEWIISVLELVEKKLLLLKLLQHVRVCTTTELNAMQPSEPIIFVVACVTVKCGDISSEVDIRLRCRVRGISATSSGI